MVYISGSKPKRTPLQKGLRFLFGTAMVTLIIFMLSQVPYDILREERFRMFGETSAVGVITSIETKDNGTERQFVIQYSYADQDGVPRQASAQLPPAIWRKYHVGSRIRVIFARSHPGLSRVEGEIEPSFQLWLRRMLD